MTIRRRDDTDSIHIPGVLNALPALTSKFTVRTRGDSPRPRERDPDRAQAQSSEFGYPEVADGTMEYYRYSGQTPGPLALERAMRVIEVDNGSLPLQSPSPSFG